MRTVIIANGLMNGTFSPQPDDKIIAADGGAKYCLDLGIQPDVIIGDLDSLSPQDQAVFTQGGAEIIRYPRRKDFSDLELALQYARDHNAREVLLLGALGERWDQTLANLLLPAAFKTLAIRLIDGQQEISFLSGGNTLEISGQPGDIVSLIPLEGDAAGVATQGLEYPLSGGTLLFGNTRGISNVLLNEHASISLQEGLLICTIIHQTN